MLRWSSHLDLVLAAGVTAWGLAELEGEVALGVAGALLVGLPLAIRRSFPLITALLAGAGFVLTALQDVPPEPLSQLVALLVAPYSLAAYAPLREAVAGAVALLALGMAEVRLVGDADYLFFAVLLTIAWTAGRVFGAGHRRALAAEAEAGRLALERERALAEERERIARELHDVVAHAVTVMVMQAGAASEVLDTDTTAARRSLEAVQAAGREAVDDLRRLLGVLRGPDEAREPAPGLGALDTLIAGFARSGLTVDADLGGAPGDLPAGLDLTAYRIVQEGLTNALRHGDGSARLRVRRADGTLEIDVTNTPQANGAAGSGLGLAGIRERAELFGGKVDIATADGVFSLRARLPAP
jgi:signal transduction histidine kinase